jgi:hypothetical protein
MARSGRQPPFAALAEALMTVHTSYLVLREGRKSVNIRSSSGVIRGIPAKQGEGGMNRPCLAVMGTVIAASFMSATLRRSTVDCFVSHKG